MTPTAILMRRISLPALQSRNEPFHRRFGTVQDVIVQQAGRFDRPAELRVVFAKGQCLIKESALKAHDFPGQVSVSNVHMSVMDKVYFFDHAACIRINRGWRSIP